MAHNTTTPSPHCAARVLRGRSANTPRDEKRAGRAPPDLHATAASVYSPCQRPVTVLVRSILGRRRGEERALRWLTTQSCHKSALRRVRHGRSADTPRGETLAGRAPLEL